MTDDTPTYVDLGSGPKYFSFDVSSSRWAVVGLRMIDGNDHDLMVDDESTFTDPKKYSEQGETTPDFIVINGHLVSGSHYAQVYYNAISGNYVRIEAQGSSTYRLGIGETKSGTIGNREVNDMYEAYLNSGTNYIITLHRTSGSADLDLYLYARDIDYENIVSATVSSDNDDGSDEVISYTPASSGYVGIVVVHDGTSELLSNAGYTINIVSAPSPTTTTTTTPTTSTTTTTPTTSSTTTTTLPNNPPVANAGPDFWVTQGESFSLDGSASSDPDEDPLSYSWSDEYGEFTGETGVNPTVTLNIVDHGSKKVHNITLTVSDGRGGEHKDTVEVTVIPKWVPNTWTDLEEVDRTENIIAFMQNISWNEDHLNYFKSGDVDYQWELRRPDTPNAWDFIIYDPSTGECTSEYWWTNLPGYPDDIEAAMVSEEAHWILDENDNKRCKWQANPTNNEELEIRVKYQDDLQPNVEYSIYVELARRTPEITLEEIVSKSEYCGDDWAFCEYMPKYIIIPQPPPLPPITIPNPLYTPPVPPWEKAYYKAGVEVGKIKFDYYEMESKEDVTS